MIGERLAELRKLNGEKQQVLAKALSVSVSTVRSWEHDKSSPDHGNLCKTHFSFPCVIPP